MKPLPHLLPLVAPCLGFYAAASWGAAIYASYRYEPSGIQYLFLPVIAAPVCGVLAVWLVFAVRSTGAPRMLGVIPFAAALVLALPGFGMLLADANLELARWATLGLAVAHLAVLIRFAVRRARTQSLTPPA